MLYELNYSVHVYVLGFAEKSSDDFKINAQRLTEVNPGAIVEVLHPTDIPALEESDVVIDAIFGTGLSKPAEGIISAFIRHINHSSSKVISVDIPSGLFADVPSDHNSAIIKADYTLSFEVPKLAFMFAENYQYTGDWKILSIGLDQKFIENLPSNKKLVDQKLVSSILKVRSKFSHKGNYGHALLIAGSYGKVGAAVLAARACLRSGTGLLTVHVPRCGYSILQTAVPEAMIQTDSDENIYTSQIEMKKFSAVGVGPGIGIEEATKKALTHLIKSSEAPMVLDADAINILGDERNLISGLPENTVLTPHIKEFERITEKAKNDFHRHELQIEFAVKHKVIVVLKGAHTCIALPDGSVYFNNTGNPGMAKGGSGDALTGIILSLLAKGYSPADACIAGVHIHGLAGDIAAEEKGVESMLASDLIENIGSAYKEIWKLSLTDAK